MFTQSEDLSQTSNPDYNFLNSASQNSSKLELDPIQNKNQSNIFSGQLDIINEENNFSPMKFVLNNDSKKLMNEQDQSKSSKFSFGVLNLNNNLNVKTIDSNPLNTIQNKSENKSNKENINTTNMNTSIDKNGLQFNFDNYKCQLSQQIDQVEKIATQSMDNNSSFNKLNQRLDSLSNNINEEEIEEHKKFNQRCSDIIDKAMNKNLEYIDNMKNNFVNCLEKYKCQFKNNAEITKKLILLFSDDVFLKEKNKITISKLTEQLMAHINSFFQEMAKFNSFNLNMNNDAKISNDNY